jgi:hypothetical protein
MAVTRQNLTEEFLSSHELHLGVLLGIFQLNAVGNEAV